MIKWHKYPQEKPEKEKWDWCYVVWRSDDSITFASIDIDGKWWCIEDGTPDSNEVISDVLYWTEITVPEERMEALL